MGLDCCLVSLLNVCTVKCGRPGHGFTILAKKGRLEKSRHRGGGGEGGGEGQLYEILYMRVYKLLYWTLKLELATVSKVAEEIYIYVVALPLY